MDIMEIEHRGIIAISPAKRVYFDETESDFTLEEAIGVRARSKEETVCLRSKESSKTKAKIIKARIAIGEKIKRGNKTCGFLAPRSRISPWKRRQAFIPKPTTEKVSATTGFSSERSW